MRKSCLLIFPGVLLLSSCLIPSERNTSAPSVDVPEWAKDAVWYQIFPERFRNGDPANDPRPEDMTGSWPHVIPEGWRISDWTSDWYDRADWERDYSNFYYETVNIRRYGGDIAGILEKLPYLDSLGVTAIYLNPVFESPSLHKYDGTYYHHVDNNFGPDPDGDRRLWETENPGDPSTWTWTSADLLFLDLIREAHARNIRIIIDGVFNHMGMRSFVFEDILGKQSESIYADWLTVSSWDDPDTPDTSEFFYEGWNDVRELPELREDAGGLIPAAREYVLASVRRWMDPNGDANPDDGIDGWRLDVAEMVHLNFWRIFRSEVRSINPAAYLAGEVWWEDWPSHVMFNATPWLEGDAFDAVMNYRWARAVRRLFIGSDKPPGRRYDPADFHLEIDGLRNDYPSEVNYALMNTLDSHDTDRILSQIINPGTSFDHDIGVRDNLDYQVRGPREDELETLRLILAHQYTYIGAPHIYYGDEAGMWGADDPDERKPMVWDDMTYSPESSHPYRLARPVDPVVFNHDLFDYYRALIRIRKMHPALRRGSFEGLSTSEPAGVLAYERRFGTDVVWVLINLDEREFELSVEITTECPAAGHTPPVSLAGRTAAEALSGAETVLTENGLNAIIPPRTAQIWSLAR